VILKCSKNVRASTEMMTRRFEFGGIVTKRTLAVLAAVCVMATAAGATPNLGTWTTPGDFAAGPWQELFLGVGRGRWGTC